MSGTAVPPTTPGTDNSGGVASYEQSMMNTYNYAAEQQAEMSQETTFGQLLVDAAKNKPQV